MKYIILIVILCIYCLPLQAQKSKACKNFKQSTLQSIPPDLSLNEWELVFEDTFESNTLDTNKWLDSYPWGRNLIFNPEKQYYTCKGNIETSNGVLKLIARQKPITGRVVDQLPDSAILDDGKINLRSFDFTSGMIFSTSTFLYGKFEIRCRIPQIKGVWPAFWLYGQCAEEIDVFEFMNDKNKLIDMTIHGQPDCTGETQYCPYQYKGKNYAKDFHTFSVEWDELKIIFRIDGKIKRTYYHYYTQKVRPIKSYSELRTSPEIVLENRVYPIHPMYVISNLAVKKETGIFPAIFEIDYVRIYQRKN